MYDINSIDDLVVELGGPSKIGSVLGISQEAVSNWGVRGAIPGGWHITLAAMVHRAGKSVSPRVFNLTEKDVEGLWPSRRPLGRKAQSAVA